MNDTTRTLLKFLPLAVFFVVFAVAINDLKHPAVTEDDCTVLATGENVTQGDHTGKSIYRQSEDPRNDVALDCPTHGKLLLNDVQLTQTAILKGQSSRIVRKQYHYMPDRWNISVKTGKPKNEAKDTPTPKAP